MERRLKKSNPAVSGKIRALRQEIGNEFGLVSRVVARVAGPFLLWSTIREERRLARGVTSEPEPVLERRNWVSAEERASTEPVGIWPPARNVSEELSPVAQCSGLETV